MEIKSSDCHHDHICWGAHLEHPGKHRLVVNQLSVSYGETIALQNISFSTTCGKTIALMGPNGAGKTTLIKSIAGLIKPHAGQILWNDLPLHLCPRELAYLPQHNDIDWSFPITVRTLVEMGRYPILGPWKKFGEHDHNIVEKSLRELELIDLANRQISELSGGQQQRCFLARALAQEAHILLLDEPFTGLDAHSGQTLGHLLNSLAKEGRLIIASHHDLHTAGEIFEQVLLLNRELIALDSPANVLTAERIADVYHIFK